ncbi:glycosyltransferase family 4 protein [Gonapodya prolifera JEL478]|uniref:Glycosyltransferase family 4 protein n=1 Tax=Gonapodya prolifera (strain JEL478) TaxID=1344416 RepID=A0A139AZ07_GONPJ|nr:glycosyltransferase family 4 protein [Gonapodya prolifera JEL478]|eukprot:KXS21971.1 glycosyltransferase family 4 protein [Gonapodya prolifera JEL478]
MDGGGEARETWVYGYSSKIAQVPKSRTIYTGPFDATYLLRARDPQESQSWKETQEFFARTGQVFKATIRVDKGTSTKQLQASYSYSTEEDSEEWPLIESAEYRASDENWVLTTQLSRGWRPDSGTAPKFAMVEYKEPNELYRVRFDYSHPQHTKFDCVRIDSSGNETMVPPPPFIMNDKYGLLRRPPPLTFHSSNEMLTVHYSPRMKVPGAIARTFDLDLVLRRERVLRSYFRSRDLGDLHGSEVALQAKKGMLDIILSVPDTPETRSSSMHVRLPDLKELATGGDSSLVASQTDDSPDVLKVVAVDSGTFPTGGGGVGSCRRDLINYLQRVRWTCLAELGTAEVAQREYQLEKHIEAIFYLTLWDLDFGNPNENFHRSVSGVDLEMRRLRATPQAIRDGFVPLIRTLVRAIFDNHLCASKVPVYEAVFVQIHEFCQVHDWTFSWESNSSIDAFIAEVLELCDTATRQGSALAIESPNLHEIGLAYSLITKMLLPLSTALPEFPDKRPCFHTSHHGVQAIVGVVAKSLTGATLVVWDHGILWRERLFALCDTDEMPRFVQIAFAGLTRLIAWLVMQRADAINSCTSIQNPMWEAHLGGAKFEDLDTKAMLQSKISPVVNGMNVARFKPNSELELPTPTAVMLSHISPVKDVVNAIEATNVIVNTFGLKNFTLHVYGSPEKDPAYTAECTSLIASYNLQKHVLLKGLGNPGAVLPTGWVFVNSSITEGLPLALGEAGLCGLPVVCTDVGGSREVISDLGTGVVYGAIAPPSRPRQLAQAILAVLAMTDGLESVVEQTSPSSGSSLSVRDFVARGAEGVNELEARITSESTKALRRKMGLMLRERTIQKFSINKYWRVHEQMLYLGSAYTPWLKVHKKRPTISAVPS